MISLSFCFACRGRASKDWREGVVLFRAEGPEAGQRWAAQPDDRAGVLEGDRVRPAHPERSRPEKADWAEEDAGVLPRAGPARDEDGLGHE